MNEEHYVTDFEYTNQCVGKYQSYADKCQFYSKFFKTYEEAYDCMSKHVKAISNDYGPYIVKRSCGRGSAQLVIHFPDSLHVYEGNEIELNWRIYKL